MPNPDSSASIDYERITSKLWLADRLREGSDQMQEPQDLPGRYGQVVGAIDSVLAAIDCQSVVAGGWAVWRHGYVGRVTENIDIVIPKERIAEFLSVASLSGFQILGTPTGMWPKMMHRRTQIQVDILPEGERPDVAPDFAPTTIPSPQSLGAGRAQLSYTTLFGLVELKLAAGRLKDQADVVELIRQNGGEIERLRAHLKSRSSYYLERFNHLVQQAEQDENR